MMAWNCMARSAAVLLIGASLLSGTVAVAADLSSAVQIDSVAHEILIRHQSENIVLPSDEGGRAWHLDGAYDQPNYVMHTFVQDGETGQNWTEMVTAIALKNKDETDAGRWIAEGVKRIQSHCGGFEILANDQGQQTDAIRVKDGLPATYQTYSVLVHCEGPWANQDPGYQTKKHEVVWFKSIQGFETTYLVQRAWHGDDIAPDSILASPATRQVWKAWIDQVAVRGIPDGATPK
jgi:hypothetical protein